MDYYSILGVPKDASEKDIKQAYKKKSMQHHPDRGGNEEEFKRVNEAYQNLSNPHKRAMYDHSQTAGQDGFNWQPYHGTNFSDNINDIFGFARARRNPHANKDIKLTVDLELTDVLYGKDLIARYRLFSGSMQEANINIPKGVSTGQTIRFPGLGDNTIPHLQRGNLLIEIRVKKHPEYERDGRDLHKVIDIDAFDAIIGTKVIIKTIEDRRLELKIPPGTQPGSTLSIPEYGLPMLNNQNLRRGHIFVHINVNIPKSLNTEQLKIIRELKNGIDKSPE